MNILSGRVMLCLPHNIWPRRTGLLSQSEINVLLRRLPLFQTCSRSDFQLLNSDVVIKMLLVSISLCMLFLGEDIFKTTSKMCARSCTLVMQQCESLSDRTSAHTVCVFVSKCSDRLGRLAVWLSALWNMECWSEEGVRQLWADAAELVMTSSPVQPQFN